MSDRLAGRVYIVTGGSKGFGFAIAEALVQRGARVGLLGRGRKDLEQAVAALGEANAFGVVADVTCGADIADAFDRIMHHFGRLDGLINNAGVARPGAVEQLIEQEVLLQIHTNLLGTILCCQAAIPLLRAADNARIVNISSASAWHMDEMRHLSVYAATKAAVERFSRDLRVELQAYGIGVSCIRPGAAWTSFADGWDPATIRTAFAAWQDAGPRMDAGMEPAQVAAAVVHVLDYPPGVAVDLLEVRPTMLIPKPVS